MTLYAGSSALCEVVNQVQNRSSEGSLPSLACPGLKAIGRNQVDLFIARHGMFGAVTCGRRHGGVDGYALADGGQAAAAWCRRRAGLLSSAAAASTVTGLMRSGSDTFRHFRYFRLETGLAGGRAAGGAVAGKLHPWLFHAAGLPLL